MSSHEIQQERTRSISLTGFLTILLGVACALIDSELAETIDGYFKGAHYVLILVGLILCLLGVRHMWISYFPPRGTPRESLKSVQRVLLPREGMVYLLIMIVLFSGSMLGRSNLLLLVFTMMAGPFILNGWMTFAMLKNSMVARKLPRRAMAGKTTSVEIELINQNRFQASWLMAARDRVVNDREELRPTIMFIRVPPRGSRLGYYRMRLMQRGKYRLGPVELFTRFPLGMVERGLTIRIRDELIVHPRIGRLTPRWKRNHLAASEVVIRQQMRRGIFDDDVSSIREYRGGDNPRAIHWRTSARKNELMVREYQQNRNYDLAIYLDLWIPDRPSDSDLERVELAVSFCATVCVEFSRQSRDARLRLLVAGSRLEEWSGEASSMSLEPVLDILALIEPTRHPDVEQLLQDGVEQNHARTRCLWITTRPQGQIDPLAKDNGRSKTEGIDERLSSFDVIEADPDRLATMMIWD